MSVAPIMNDKVCLVTGVTSGIGQATAHAPAQLGATVVLVGRDPEKSERAVDAIRHHTGNERIDAMIADLSVQADVRRLATEFHRRYQRLHVLVNNAGGVFFARQESPDGIELTFALNHLGYVLLTNLLVDTLTASAPSRVVNVAALLHRFATLHLDDLQSVTRPYKGWRAYRESKLASAYPFAFDTICWGQFSIGNWGRSRAPRMRRPGVGPRPVPSPSNV